MAGAQHPLPSPVGRHFTGGRARQPQSLWKGTPVYQQEDFIIQVSVPLLVSYVRPADGALIPEPKLKILSMRMKALTDFPFHRF